MILKPLVRAASAALLLCSPLALWAQFPGAPLPLRGSAVSPAGYAAPGGMPPMMGGPAGGAYPPPGGSMGPRPVAPGFDGSMGPRPVAPGPAPGGGFYPLQGPPPAAFSGYAQPGGPHPGGPVPSGALPGGPAAFAQPGAVAPYQGEMFYPAAPAGGPYTSGSVYSAPAAAIEPYADHAVWAQFDYLLWFREGRPLPPLATTSPPGTPRNAGPLVPIAATIGSPGGNTQILFGNQRVDEGGTSGGDLNFGLWLDPSNEIGIAGRFYALDEEEIEFQRASTAANPILGIPIFNVNINTEDALLVGFMGAPGPQSTGSMQVRSTNEFLGSEAYFRLHLLHFLGRRQWPGGGRARFSIDAYSGYQFNRINDQLFLSADITSDIPSRFTFFDSFRTKNQFHGGMFGLAGEIELRRWALRSTGKIGVGNMHQSVRIEGQNTTSVLGFPPVTSMGGLFTQPTNIGKYTRDHFAYVPELKFDLYYQLTERFRFHVGYDFIWFNSVVLGADQLDRRININQLGGGMLGGAAPVPAFSFNDTDFWAMGLNLGVLGEF